MNFTSSHEEAKVEDVARGEQTAVKATALTAIYVEIFFRINLLSLLKCEFQYNE